MPFSGPDDPKLKPHVQKLPKPQREKWVSTFNSVFANCRKESTGGGAGSVEKCEKAAFAIANNSIKKETDMDDETKDTEVRELTPAEKMHMEGEYAGPTPVVVVEDVSQHQPLGGSQSFEELDQYIQARDQEFAVNKVTWSAQDLISNVMGDPDVENKPDKLQTIVDGMRTRLGQAMTKVASVISPEVESDKQTTKTEDGVKFRASDYAVVPDPDKPSEWKLRLAEVRSGNFTVRQVAQAITAMQPGGFRGQKVELTSEQKTQAVKRIGTAIGKTDGTDDQKENLRTRLNKVKDIPGAFKNFEIVKTKDGGMRWIGIPTNKWRDRDTPAQIISEEAHKEFVEHLDRTKDFPVLLSWHTPGTRIGVADVVDYSNGFLVMGGAIDKDKYAEAERLAAKCQTDDIGMSHGFVYTYSDKENEIIGHYRIWEVSHLPTSHAANVWTSIDILKKEASKTMRPEAREYLVGIHGEEKVSGLEGKLVDLEKELASLGIESKDVFPPEPPDTDAIMEATAKAIVESEGFKALIDTVAAQGAAIKEVQTLMATIQTAVESATNTAQNAETKAQKKVDDIIAEAVTARSGAFQPSKDAPEVAKGDELAGPEVTDGFEPGFMDKLTQMPGAQNLTPATPS